MCFRRFNGTNQFGCQSKQDGSVGAIHIVRSESDIEHIISTGPNSPYIPCLSTRFFTYANILKFQKSDRVTGLVLFDNHTEELPESLTEDQRCPNVMSEYYKNDLTYGNCKKQEWNQFTIQSLYELNLEFPLVLVRNQSDINLIEQCFNDFNAKTNKTSQPKQSTDLICSLQLKTWMLGAKDSKVCMSRSSVGFSLESTKYCDSVNSYNVFSTLFKYENNIQAEDRSIVMLTSRVDSLSLFDNSATGASTTSTSIITLFSVMAILRDLRNQGVLVSNGHNVMYALFDGESLDYIGSGRTAYDLGTDGLSPFIIQSTKNFNLTFYKNHLHSAIEISQATSTDNFYIHTDPLTREKESIKNQLDQLIKNLNSSSSIKLAAQDLPLPPSSVQQLLAHDHDLPVLVISNHEKKFINKFYNSFLDDERAIKDKEKVIDNIVSLSESIAKTLISVLETSKEVTVKADRNLTSKLYNCFIEDSKCSFFRDLLGRESRLQSNFKTFPLYISTSLFDVLQPYHHEYIEVLSLLSAYLNGQNLENATKKESCLKMNEIDSNVYYDWFEIKENNTNQTYCYESTRFNSQALSPIFMYAEPNWSLNYSTWTESVWNTPQVRLFVKPSIYQEYSTFITGLIIFIISFIISKWVSKKANVLFVDLVANNDAAVQM